MGIFDGTGYFGDQQPLVNNFNSDSFDFMANYGVNAGAGLPQQTSIFGPGMFQNISQGVGAFSALAQLYGMFQSLGLQKKAFKFAQEGTKRNFNANATAFNNAVASKETARHAYADASGQDFSQMYAYGTGQTVDKWT
jgi:hypothetical protein